VSIVLENLTSKPAAELHAKCAIFMDDWEAQDGELPYCFVVKSGDGKTGLLLTPTEQQGQYMRCGKFHVARKEDLVRDFQILCKQHSHLVDSRSELYEERVGADDGGCTQYIISII
jgi:hypothetical protein